MLIDPKAGVEHRAGVWFREPVREMTIFSEQYEFAITLLTLEDRDSHWSREEAEFDTYDALTRRAR